LKPRIDLQLVRHARSCLVGQGTLGRRPLSSPLTVLRLRTLLLVSNRPNFYIERFILFFKVKLFQFTKTLIIFLKTFKQNFFLQKLKKKIIYGTRFYCLFFVLTCGFYFFSSRIILKTTTNIGTYSAGLYRLSLSLHLNCIAKFAKKTKTFCINKFAV